MKRSFYKSGHTLLSLALPTLTSVALPILTANCSGALYDVELIDSDGPHIVGQVDTLTDKFTINSWTENTGGVVWWSPSDLPRTYDALTTTGLYDVPNNWDGTIGTDWGFINPLTLFDNSWTNGSFHAPTLIREGWGGRVDGFGVIDVSRNETRWLNLPFNSNSVAEIAFNSVIVTPIPEPTALALATLSLLAAASYRPRSR